jgi:ATP-dependent protease ClpP protease subunit
MFRAAVQEDGALEMLIYGDIVDGATITMLEAWGYPTDGLTSAMSIKKAIDAGGAYSKLILRINSPGGDAFEGIAAYNVIRAQGKPVEVYVDALAASSASIIAMSGDTITMAVNSMMMVHNAWSVSCGYATDMRKMADVLDKVSESIGQTYVSRTGKSAAEIKALMDAETWMSAKDCLDARFATAITEDPSGPSAQAMARSFKALARFGKVPEQFRAAAGASNLSAGYGTCECPCDECATDCSNCTHDACDCANCEGCPMKAKAATTVAPIAQAESVSTTVATGTIISVWPVESNLSLYEARQSVLGKH